MAEGVEGPRRTVLGVIVGILLSALGLFLLAVALTTIGGSAGSAAFDGLAGLLALGTGVAFLRGKT